MSDKTILVTYLTLDLNENNWNVLQVKHGVPLLSLNLTVVVLQSSDERMS